MNWHKVLFLIWLAASLVWCVYAFTESQVGCRMLANTDYKRSGCDFTDNRSALIGAVLWPAIVFALGWSALWVIGRFRTRQGT